MSLSLTWAKPGDVVAILNEIAQKSEPIMVLSSCDAAVRGYRCVSCERQLANVGQVLLHIENGGAHHLVTWCMRHSRWESADQSQIDAFTDLFHQEAAR